MVAPFCSWGLMLGLCAAVLALLAFLAWEAVKAFRSSRMRIAATFFFAAAILYGGGKRKSPDLDFAPFRGPARVLRSDAGSGFQSWGVHGAWRKSAWFQFDDGWVFPDGTNRLHGVEVLSQGRVWRTPFDTNPVAEVGVPLAVVPGLTQFGAEHTPSNSYRFVWTDAAARRDTNELVSASVELFRNGDIAVETNGVAAFLPRELPYAHDGFGQGAEWVAANFTNAEEVLSAGYAQWVDAQVGHGLTNGLYKLTATLLEDPPETTWLNVGAKSVAVTNAGEYAFLLEKGVRYPITVFPRDATNFVYDVCDDIAPQTRGAQVRSGAANNRREGPRLRGEAASESPYSLTLVAHVEDSGVVLVRPSADGDGYVCYKPQLWIAPDRVDDPTLPMQFVASVEDVPNGCNCSYDWEYCDRHETGSSFWWDDAEALSSASVTATHDGVVLHGSVSAERHIRRSSITLEGGGLMVTEEAYMNGPFTFVDESSSDLCVHAEWGLAKSGTLRLDSTCPTDMIVVRENGENGPSVVSLPCEWHASADSEEYRNVIVNVFDMSATGLIGDLEFAFESDDGTESLSQRIELRVVKIRVVADAEWPQNRVRHVFGPYETFKIHQEPSGFFTFSPGSRGHATVNGGTVTAPYLAERFTVEASSPYGSTTLSFVSIEPTDIVATYCRAARDEDWRKQGRNPPVPGEIAVGMVTYRRLLPDYVSFEHLYVEEGECPISNVWGLFRTIEEELGPHDIGAGAWNPSTVESGNFLDNDFAGLGFRAGFGVGSSGECQYNVPNFWYVWDGQTIIGGRHYFCTTPGVLRLYENGDFKVSRFECAVTRGTNGVSRVIKRP